MNVVNEVYEQQGADTTLDNYVQGLFTHLQGRDFMPLDKALAAIKKEAGILL